MLSAIDWLYNQREDINYMGKHSQASTQRLKRYRARMHEADALVSHVYSSHNIRSMWVDDGTIFDGMPRRVPSRMPLWHKGGRINAHPPFTGRSGHAKVLPMA